MERPLLDGRRSLLAILQGTALLTCETLLWTCPSDPREPAWARRADRIELILLATAGGAITLLACLERWVRVCGERKDPCTGLVHLILRGPFTRRP